MHAWYATHAWYAEHALYAIHAMHAMHAEHGMHAIVLCIHGMPCHGLPWPAMACRDPADLADLAESELFGPRGGFVANKTDTPILPLWHQMCSVGDVPVIKETYILTRWSVSSLD